MNKNKRISIIAIIFMLFINLAGCEKIEVFGKTELSQLDTREELCDFVEERLGEGEEEIHALVSADLEEDEFQQLNQYLDGYYGEIESYSYRTSLKKGYHNVTMEAKISDNYYAEQLVLEGEETEGASKKAKQLAKKAQKIVNKIIDEDMTDYEKEKKIHDYIVSNAKWEFLDGDDKDDSYHAYGVLVKGKGVCQGYAEAMQLLSNICGLETKIITGTAEGESHAWNLIKLGENWYQLDITWDDPVPDEEGRILYSYFNISDELMEKSHEWDQDLYPEAEGGKYNYFIRNGIYFDTKEEAQDYLLRKVRQEWPDVIDIMVGDYSKKSYGDDWAKFIYQAENVKAISYEMYGDVPNICFRFYFEY